MAVWFTSDWHLGEASVLLRDNRPWPSIHEHDKALVARWNQVVHPGDVGYFLGDFARGYDPYRLAELILNLNGYLVFVGGNADQALRRMVKPGTTSGYEYIRKLQAKGFEVHATNRSVIRCAEYTTSRRSMELCHYPYRQQDPLPLTLKQVVRLHGHTHTGEVRSYHGDIQQYNVGVTAHNYFPVSFEDLKKSCR